MKNANIRLETLTCPSCLQKITNGVKRLDGVKEDSVEVMFNSSRVKVEFDESKINISDIEGAITKLGFNVIRSTVK